MTGTAIWHILAGDLTWGALPFVRAWRDPSTSEIIGAAAGGMVVLGAVAVCALITWLRAWRMLWTEWFTSLDHKKIGIMYIVLALVMLTRALSEAVLIRTQQATAINAPGLVEPTISPSSSPPMAAS